MKTCRADGRAIATVVIGLGLVVIGLAIAAPRAMAQANPAGAPQPPPVAAPSVPDGSARPATQDSLSIRYRLSEMYAVTPNPATPEVLSQYQVAVRNTIKVMRDQAQGTPERHETSYQVIYTERPAQIAKATGVTDTIRRYDAFRMQPPGDTQRLKIPLLEKLTVWYRGLPGQSPQVFTLTEERSIRETEYGFITSQIFLPQLNTLLPAKAKRVGDTWQVSRTAARALLGVMPQAEDFNLTATLKEVRKGTLNTAVIAVSGTVLVDYEPTAMNARLLFTFDPKVAAPPVDARANPPAKAATLDPGTVDARGSINEIRMAVARSTPIPDDDGDGKGESRLQQTITREVILGRRPSPAGSEPLAVPTVEPAPDSPNSWVTYDDPEGRFHFRHPQLLGLPPMGPMGPNEVTLFQERPAGRDVLIIKIQPPVKDPARDRKLIDPDDHRKHLEEEWRQQQKDVLKIPPGWLPEADWAPLKRKVYRIEAAIRKKADPSAKRIYLDYYLVVFNRNQSIVVEAMTDQDPHLAFRNQAEAIIKSFKFGTSDGSPPPAAKPARTAQPSGDVEPRRKAQRTPGKPAQGRSPRSSAPRDEAAPRPQPKAKDTSEPSPFPQ